LSVPLPEMLHPRRELSVVEMMVTAAAEVATVEVMITRDAGKQGVMMTAAAAAAANDGEVRLNTSARGRTYS